MNEYRKPKSPTIRSLLLEHSDGLSVSEICLRTGVDVRVTRTCLKKMADAYIDRWILGAHQRPPEAIWCVVHVPKDCPRPTRKK